MAVITKTRTGRILAFLFPLVLLSLRPAFPAGGDDSLRRSVVKIFTTIQEPNYLDPWRVDAQQNISGSGCVLTGHRILTNAHVVSNQIFIQVLKDGDAKKYTAKTVAVAHDCDLAILKVEDPDFFKGTKPVTFGKLPALRDKVSVYGYPVGGEELSITEGVVSRIELIPYAHSLRSLLGVQTDAAINAGNSGGPVFKSRKLVGIAFQGYNAAVAQSTSFFIPLQMVQRFLASLRMGRSFVVPGLGIYAEAMENESLRQYFGMKKSQTGLLVSKVTYGSSAFPMVHEKDVLLSIDGFPLANDGTIPFRKGERLNFQYPLCLHWVGDRMKLKVLRDKKILSLSLKLVPEVRLVPYLKYDIPPTYFIFDGIIFSPLDTNYLRVQKEGAPEFTALYYDGLPSQDRKSVVLINHILPHETNKGYGSEYENLVVRRVNGVVISEMKDLLSAFEKPVNGLHIIEFDKAKELGDKIVLDASKTKQATIAILAQNKIPSDRSPDLR